MMKKTVGKNSLQKKKGKKHAYLWVLFIVIFVFFGCQKKETSQNTDVDIFGSSDETKEAVELIKQANAKLIEVKKLYVENNGKVEELQNAMNSRDVEKVKQIADDLLYKINDGMALGEDALKKIEEAGEKKINEKFQDYLRLKKQSLEKQLEAFEFRRQFARQLRDSFTNVKDAKIIEKAKAELSQKEDNFKKYMEEGRILSKQANELAKIR